MVFRRNGSTVWVVKVPDARGRWHMRSTGTRDKITAKKVQRMLDELGPEGARAWDLLDAVIAGHLPIARLFDRWATGALDQLRAELNDVDLTTMIDDWQAWIAPKVRPETAARYRMHLRTLMPVGLPFRRSQLAPAAITDWLASRRRQSGTLRKYHAALSSFVRYLLQIGVLSDTPLRIVEPPKPGKARDRHVDTDTAIAIAQAHTGPYRALSALLAGTGIEVSVALSLVRRDVDVERREIRARGTKTHNRDRVVRVAEWAWPFVLDHCRGLMPAAPLFPDINRWTASDLHREVVATQAINEPGYTLRDARHTYAVRAARGGTPPQVIARQLGHKDATLVLKVYGVYFPDSHEREHWERETERIDAARRAGS